LGPINGDSAFGGVFGVDSRKAGLLCGVESDEGPGFLKGESGDSGPACAGSSGGDADSAVAAAARMGRGLSYSGHAGSEAGADLRAAHDEARTGCLDGRRDRRECDGAFVKGGRWPDMRGG